MSEVEKKFMSIVSDDGTSEEVEVLLLFEFNDNKKEYLIYTKNEKDENGNITIYVSLFQRNEDETFVLKSVDDDNEWARIKEVLRELTKKINN